MPNCFLLTLLFQILSLLVVSRYGVISSLKSADHVLDSIPSDASLCKCGSEPYLKSDCALSGGCIHFVKSVEVYCPNRLFFNTIWRRNISLPKVSGLDILVECDGVTMINKAHSTNKTHIALNVESPSHFNPYTLINSSTDIIVTFLKDVVESDSRVLFHPGMRTSLNINSGLYLQAKRKMVISILSKKKRYEGHLLRHAAMDAIQNDQTLSSKVDFAGKGAGPGMGFSSKFPNYSIAYRYAIVIENAKQDYYFTEKLGDALLTGSVPIYWGSNFTGTFPGFDPRGIIFVNSLNDILDVLNSTVSEEDYSSRVPSLRHNLGLIDKYFAEDDRACTMNMSSILLDDLFPNNSMNSLPWRRLICLLIDSTGRLKAPIRS